MVSSGLRSRAQHFAALIVGLAQYLAGLSVDEIYPGAGKAGDRLVLVFGNVRIVIQFRLDVVAGRWAPENEMGHLSEYDGRATPDHDLAQVPVRGD